MTSGITNNHSSASLSIQAEMSRGSTATSRRHEIEIDTSEILPGSRTSSNLREHGKAVARAYAGPAINPEVSIMADESGNASFPGNRVRSDNGAAAFGSAPGINVKVSYRGKLAKWTADGKVEIPARAKSSASGAWWKKQGDYLRSMVALPVGWGQDYSAPWAAKRGAKTAEQGKATADRLRNMVPAGSGV